MESKVSVAYVLRLGAPLPCEPAQARHFGERKGRRGQEQRGGEETSGGEERKRGEATTMRSGL